MPKAMQRYRLARRRPPHDDTLRSGRNLQTAVPCVLAAAGLAALAGCDGGSGGTGASGGNGGDEREPFVSIERSGGSRTAQPPAGQTGVEQTSQADGQPVQRQADLALGTFDSNRTAAPEGEQPGGRLPVDGDRSAYIPAVSLFPGAARIDPNIANPYEGDPEAVAAGERHYQAFNCAGCHAPLGGGGMGPPLSDDAWIHGGEPAQIYLSILHGRAEGMPAWGSMLPRRAIWELVSYVQSLSEIDDYATHIGFEPDPARRWGGTGSGQQQGAGQNDEDSRGGTGQGGVGQGGSGQGGSGQGGSGQGGSGQGGSGQGGGGGQSPGSQQQGSAGQADGP